MLLPVPLYAARLGDFFQSDDFDLLHWAVRTSVLEGLVRPPWQTWFRPLTDLLWQATEAMFGQRPAGHHAVNLLLHVVNAGLVSWIAWRAAGSRVAAIAAASLFGVHPTATAAVQWLSGRYDLLATCLALASILLASACADRRRAGLAVCSVLCAVLAMLAKEAAAALPLVVLVLASPRLARTTARGHALVPPRLAWSIAALLPIYLGVRWLLFGGLGGYGQHARLDLVHLWNPLLSLPLATLPWPVDSPLDGLSRWPWLAIAAGSAVVLVWRAPLFACAYLAAFAPIVNMMGRAGFVTAEVARLMYLPLSMVAIGLGLVAGAAAGRRPRLTALALAAVLAVSATGGWSRLAAWRDAAVVTASVQDTLVRDRLGMASPALVDCRLLPDNIRGAWVYRTGYDAQARLALGERVARATRPGDAVWPRRDEFASQWCLAGDGRSLRRGLCDAP